MVIVERLQERIKARGISQAELARRIEMTQPALNQLFNGHTRSTTKIRQIARELNTTSEYLEGVTDDPNESFAESSISDQERAWLDALRPLDMVDREALLTLARSLGRTTAPPTLHDGRQDYKAG